MKTLVRILTAAALAVVPVTGEAKDVTSCSNCAELEKARMHKNGGGLTVLGLTTDQRLLRFKERRPDKTPEIGTISGLQPPDTAHFR